MQTRFSESTSISAAQLGGLRVAAKIMDKTRSEDAVDIFSNSNMNDMRKPLKIHFKGEDGVDEGGLTKEFCSLVVSKFLNDTTLFTLDKGTNRWWFSPPRYKYKGTQLVKEQVPLNLFELFGTLIGISIYNGVYLDLRFPNILFQHLVRL